MNNNPELIVMLTHHDRTVGNAHEIFEQCKNSKAKCWGFKEEGLPADEMKKLFSLMKKCGKTTVLEVVAYTEKECMNGAKLASECGCDILMGTLFFDSVNNFCKENNIRYMPFVGKVSGRPSVLEGSVEEITAQAIEYLKKGVFGFDLLGYRYTGNPHTLIENFVSKVNAPVCIAGNINNYNRLAEVRQSGAWAFTIGGAFFEKRFADSFEEQINAVCSFTENMQEEYNDF